MANYKKRPKLKRYRRSFYSRGMRLKKGIGIAVLVAVVLVVGWLAAPHVLDWATHTWYTVVRNRDLSASSAVSQAESASSSAASSEAASSSVAESTQESTPTPTLGTAIVEGSWAEVDVSTLTDEAAIRAEAQRLAAQGTAYAVIPLKDAAGSLYYASQVAAASGSVVDTPVDAAAIASIFKANGILPVAQLTAFRDPAGARADHNMAIRYRGQEYLWLDNKASAGGNPWLNPYADAAVQYIGDLIAELHHLGFDHVLLENVQFPSSTSSKQDYGSTNGVDRSGQLAADIAAWQTRFGSEVTLWYGYSLSQVTDSTSTLGAPASQLGMKNLLVEVPSSATLDEAEQMTLIQTLTDAGIEHVVIRDDAAGRFE